MKFLEKLKTIKNATQMGVGGTYKKIDEIQKSDQEFKEKELALFGEMEDKIDLIIKKLDNIERRLK